MNVVTAPIKRGKHMEPYCAGKMHGFGARQPRGRTLGEAYSLYAGAEAKTVRGMLLMHEAALVSTSA
jgi:hypothetical protein